MPGRAVVGDQAHRAAGRRRAGGGEFCPRHALAGAPRLRPARLASLCTAGGLSAVASGRKLGFEKATTDEAEVFDDPAIDAVVSITRHDLHARHVIRAVESGKAIFVEKPLCLTEEELAEIEIALPRRGRGPFADGRLQPAVFAGGGQSSAILCGCASPPAVAIRFNAGPLPAEHWLNNEAEGGGRIIGEACHAIDLAASSWVRRRCAFSLNQSAPPSPRRAASSVSSLCVMRTARSPAWRISRGAIDSFPKERVEVFGGGRVAVIDDFRSVTLCRGGRTTARQTARAGQGPPRRDRSLRSGPHRGEPGPHSVGRAAGRHARLILAVRSLVRECRSIFETRLPLGRYCPAMGRSGGGGRRLVPVVIRVIVDVEPGVSIGRPPACFERNMR